MSNSDIFNRHKDMENFEHIMIFKTNVSTLQDKELIGSILNGHADIEQWHIDLEDEDCVLRVVSYNLKYDGIEKLIREQGYNCMELTY